MDIQDGKSILENVSKYQTLTDQITNSLQLFLKLKQGKVSSKDHEFLELKANTLFTLKEMKNNHKDLYLVLKLNQLIEQNNAQSQIEKERMEEKQKYLECLRYRKCNFLNQIATSRNLRTPELSKVYFLVQSGLLSSELKVFSELKQREKLLPTDNLLKTCLIEELQQRAHKQKEFKDCIKEKGDNELQLKSKETLLSKIPENIKRLEGVIGGFMEIFGIKEYKHPEQVLLAKKLPDALFVVYTNFVSMIDTGDESHISVLINEIKTSDKREKSKYDVYPFEIVIKLNLNPKDEETLTKESQHFNTNVNDILSQVYPFTMTIRYLEYFNALLISNDPRSFFNSDQIFSMLIDNEIGRNLFVSPSIMP